MNGRFAPEAAVPEKSAFGATSAPMGKSRKRAVDIRGVQHQSGRCGSRASGRTSRKTIANGGRPAASRGRSIPQFPKALGLIQDVGELAEKEGYHPDINFGRVMRLSRRTKKIKGLHENDFVMASKTNRLLDRPDDFLDHKK